MDQALVINHNITNFCKNVKRKQKNVRFNGKFIEFMPTEMESFRGVTSAHFDSTPLDLSKALEQIPNS